MTLKKLAAVAASLMTLGGLVYAGIEIDERYEKSKIAKAERQRVQEEVTKTAREKADELAAYFSQEFIEQKVKIEKGDLETQIDLIRSRISILANKTHRTPDEEEELRSLRKRRDRIEARLEELRRQ